MLLTILLIADIILTLVLYKRYSRYEKALKKIASAELDMNKIVAVAIKALKGVD